MSDAPLAFIETGGPLRGAQEESDGSDSKRNPAEAERVLKVLDGVLSAGEVSTSQIGVVTPYKAQVRLLRSMWRERGGAQLVGVRSDHDARAQPHAARAR